MNPLRASVIVPVGSDRGFLGEALASAARQEHPPEDYEVVVVNDGCAALDEARVRALWPGPAPLVYRAQPRRGLSAAVNHALSVARGRYFTVLPDDDRILPGKLSLLCGWLDCHPDADVVYSLPEYIDGLGRPLETPPVLREFLRAHPVLRWEHVTAGAGLWIHGTSTVYRVGVVAKVGGWDEALDTAEEYEFHLRLLARGVAFHAVEAVTTSYRLHRQNKSRGFRGKRQRQMSYIYEKLGLK